MFINTFKTKIIAAFIILSALGVAALTFLIPVAATVQNALAAHTPTAVATVASTLTLAAAFWFVQGLTGFTAQSRKAYLFISSGLALFGLALLQIPIVGMFDLWQSFWTSSGLAVLPFIFPFVVVYMGLRIFTKLLQIRTILNNVWFAFIVAVSLVGATLVVGPLFIKVDDPQKVAVSLALIVWGVAFTAFSLLLTHKVRPVIGQYYKKAMLYLEVALMGLFVSGLHEYTASFFLTNGNPYADYGFYIWPWVVSGVLLLYASYQFRILTVPSIRTSGELQISDKDYVDSIVTVAALASSPKEIDPILDDLRVATARAGTEGAFTKTEKEQLITSYLRLEEYFMRNLDPLRSLTKQQLRQYVTPAFRLLLSRL